MLRIFDANINRCCEGLRVIEEVARFLLNNKEISGTLKRIRHQLSTHHSTIDVQLLNIRDAESDIGITSDVAGEYIRPDINSIVVANSRRIQESLRVLEEFAKLPDNDFLDPEKIKLYRFEIYRIEQTLLSRLLRKDKITRLTGLYFILDYQYVHERNETSIASQAIKGGARIIQLRDKYRSKSEILKTARELKKICFDNNVLFIMNDHIDLTIASDADGVHLGQSDMPVSEARKILAIDKIIGCSSTSVDEACSAEKEGADYVAVGSIYPTSSKSDIKIAGLETLRSVKTTVSIPVVAIGGIQENNVSDVLDAGADAVAVISAIMSSNDIEKSAHRLSLIIKDKNSQ